MKRSALLLGAVLCLSTLGLPAARGNHPANTCLQIDGVGLQTTYTAGQTASVEADLAVASGSTCTNARANSTNGTVNIEFVVEAGANEGATFDCRIPQGEAFCVGTYVGKQAGSDSVRGWVDHDKDGVFDSFELTDSVIISWRHLPNTLDCDDTIFAPGDDFIERDTERETNVGSHQFSSQIYYCFVYGATAGTFAPAGTLVFGEVLTAVNDPDSIDGVSYTTQDYVCEINSQGYCAFDIPQIEMELGTTTICFWVGTTADGSSLCGNEAVGENQSTANLVDSGNDFADAMELRWVPYSPNVRLDCTPETEVSDPGSDQTITCSATTTPSLVNVEIVGEDDPDNSNSPTTPDLTCETFSLAGACTVTHDIDANSFSVGSATYIAWIDIDRSRFTSELDTTEGQNESLQPGATVEPDATDVVTHQWLDVATVDCSVETDVAVPDTDAEITCVATNATGAPASLVLVKYERTGLGDNDGDTPADPDGDCITGADGSCEVSFNMPPEEGTAVWRWWVDSDRDDDTIEADLAEGRNESQVPGNEVEPDDTDVVERIFRQPMPTLDCAPEAVTSETGTPVTLSCTARDESGDAASGQGIDIEASGFGDPDGAESFTTPDFTCLTVVSGGCTIDFTPPAGTGTTLFRAWIDVDSNNATVEADVTEGVVETQAPGTTAEPDGTDAFQRSWMEDAPPPATCPGFENDPRNQVVGTSATETLQGTEFNDIICGFGGDDQLLGLRGDDLLLGGGGADVITAKGGADTLKGGGGDDVLRGGGGIDVLIGGRGVDSCAGGPGQDVERSC